MRLETALFSSTSSSQSPSTLSYFTLLLLETPHHFDPHLQLIKMLTKTTFLALATSIALVRAQEFTDIDVHSTSNCNPDPNDLEADSMQLSFSPETDDQGNQFSGCMEATIGLPGWPVTDNGKYTAWVDTSKFGEGCSMLFFNLAGSQEEGDSEYPCRNGLYRKIQKDKTPCGDLDLTEKFGYA